MNFLLNQKVATVVGTDWIYVLEVSKDYSEVDRANQIKGLTILTYVQLSGSINELESSPCLFRGKFFVIVDKMLIDQINHIMNK